MSQTKPSIVFAHGLWADGSCFSKVIPALQADGLRGDCRPAQPRHARRRRRRGDPHAGAGQQPGHPRRPLLRRHRHHGRGNRRPRRRAGLHRRARPGRGRDVAEPAGQVPRHATSSPTSRSPTGASGCCPDGVRCFAGDLSEEEQKLVWATQVAPDADLFNQKVEGTAWRSKPSWYIVAKNDRTVHPELERFVAKRMGATTYEVDSSHVPMLSNPGFVLDVIRAAANGV